MVIILGADERVYYAKQPDGSWLILAESVSRIDTVLEGHSLDESGLEQAVNASDQKVVLMAELGHV